MRTIFSKEEIAEFKRHPCVFHCSERSIHYTSEEQSDYPYLSAEINTELNKTISSFLKYYNDNYPFVNLGSNHPDAKTFSKSTIEAVKLFLDNLLADIKIDGVAVRKFNYNEYKEKAPFAEVLAQDRDPVVNDLRSKLSLDVEIRIDGRDTVCTFMKS